MRANDVVVIVDVTKAVAIANDPANDKAPSATAVTLNDSKDQIDTSGGDVAANLQWTLADAGDNKCYFKKDDSNYLFVKASPSKDDGLRVGAPADGDVKAFGLTSLELRKPLCGCQGSIYLKELEDSECHQRRHQGHTNRILQEGRFD